MITRVAIWTKDKIFIGEEKARHHSIYRAQSEDFFHALDHIQGFITDTGEFLNRKEAGKHAFECNQINSETDCLMSEDLW